MLGSARRYFAQALKKMLPSRWPLLRLFRSSAPHSGQSSQLSSDLNHRSAQFLPAVARSALNLPSHSESRALGLSVPSVQRVNVTAHAGHSSQLVLTATLFHVLCQPPSR